MNQVVMVVALLIALSCIILRSMSFEWGKSFDGLVQTENVLFDCEFNCYPTCCALLDPTYSLNIDPKLNNRDWRRSTDELAGACTLSKEYHPSPYEKTHLAKAYKLDKIAKFNKRRKELVSFINADVDAANIWLARVKEHMTTSAEGSTVTKADYHYLSRFEVTRTCTGKYASLSSKWIEWIEPLTIHARHPFSMHLCQPAVYTEKSKQKMKFSSSIVGMDYVLLKSGHDIHRSTSYAGTNHNTTNNSNTKKRIDHSYKHRTNNTSTPQRSRNFLFDAGTSTFESSLVWFLCAYWQRGISFDQIYGYEYTLLEPQDFWRRVPDRIKPLYHFYNTPITAGAKDAFSPLRFIREVASEKDFVSYKLDVDTASVEIPQALALLVDPELSQLVDEFFFELHFRCEIMTTCGWQENDMSDDYGIQLDRSHALQFFQDMRILGIRAHIWP